MLVFVVGTTAEIIKVAPVMRELRRRAADYQLWSTDQHMTGVQATLDDLELDAPEVDLVIDPARRAHVAATSQVPGWFARVGWTVLRHRRTLRARLRADGRRGIVVVHGDTFSTVIGALIGRFLGADVAHVEAGLRSGSLRNPFPEEINRRIVGRLATIHFAPTTTEVENLRRAHAPGRTVLTHANTVVDALRFAMHGEPPVALPPQFGLATLHRYELLRDPASFEAIVRTLHEESTVDLPIVMLAGHSERAKLEELRLLDLFDGERFRLIPKQAYAAFLPILTRASFVVTDSGGLQEECAALGVPCAVHRRRTERFQGIGRNVVLTQLDIDQVKDFLRSWRTYRHDSVLELLHPSEIIADDLLATSAGQ